MMIGKVKSLLKKDQVQRPSMSSDENVDAVVVDDDQQAESQGGPAAAAAAATTTETENETFEDARNIDNDEAVDDNDASEVSLVDDNDSSSMTEVTHQEALQRLLDDKSLSDVTLQGTDDVLVHTSKGLLGARSKVFRSLLFRDDLAQSVPIGYKGEVIKAVVEYIYLDTCKVLTTTERRNVQWADTMVSLMEAAEYFNLYTLQKLVEDCVCTAMKKDSSIACMILAICHDKDGDADDEASQITISGVDIEDAAMNAIRKKPQELIEQGKEAVGNLSPELIGKIIGDKQMETDELTIFKVLNTWVSQAPTAAPTATEGDGEKVVDRTAVGLELTKHIDLGTIDPADLAAIVAPSNLVTMEQLLEAYKHQAISATSKAGMSFKQQRYHYIPTWLGTKSSTKIRSKQINEKVYLLDLPKLTNGTFKWKVKILQASSHIGLGVTNPSEIGTWLGGNSNDFGYGSDGRTYHDDKCTGDVLQTYEEGSVVTFTMQLYRERRGSLWASIDSSIDKVLLFNNIPPQKAEEDGLVPAVSLNENDAVEIMAYEHVSADSKKK